MTAPLDTPTSRRTLFTATATTAAVGGLAAAGCAPAPVAETQSSTDSDAPTDFVHPGLLHTEEDFTRMAAVVADGAEPWASGWERLTGNGRSQSTWTPRPLATVVRGGEGTNVGQFYTDVHAAYQNALRWRVGGDEAHAEAARDIINAWSAELTEVTGNADRYLAAGLYGYQLANAAEIVRDYDGFDLGRCQEMLLTVFYPLNDRFLREHNDACVSNYWANWDLCNMAAIMSTGILCDERAMFDQAVDYFKEGGGNGAIGNAVPHLHDGGLGQWQESGRDQAHSILGIGLMATVCETAWSQGVDLYGYDDDRFMKGCEYVARYNLGEDVPYTPYEWETGQNCDYRVQEVISEQARGQVRPVWEMVYNHYAVRRCLEVPNVAAIAERQRAEGGGGDYGFGGGGFDALGFGTLAYTL
ncbi:alginate lyase family protein [Nocardiopsis aegyptia]|uniref:alginate lyase family protein n=1 Tax=Nocardiopsis aegyptia TaxID=220378 RepID=UPI00366D5380